MTAGGDQWYDELQTVLAHAKPRRAVIRGAVFEYEYEYRFTEYEYERSFLGGCYRLRFSYSYSIST